MAKNKNTSQVSHKFKKPNTNKHKGNKSSTGFKSKYENQRNFTNKLKDVNSNEKFVENNSKINYVLHPRLLKKKMKDIKESERKEKEKSFQLKKRKRNAIYMKTTDKGQPKLNARMKILYDQIARSCEKT